MGQVRLIESSDPPNTTVRARCCSHWDDLTLAPRLVLRWCRDLLLHMQNLLLLRAMYAREVLRHGRPPTKPSPLARAFLSQNKLPLCLAYSGLRLKAVGRRQLLP